VPGRGALGRGGAQEGARWAVERIGKGWFLLFFLFLLLLFSIFYFMLFSFEFNFKHKFADYVNAQLE
jgi:hypothetical protein